MAAGAAADWRSDASYRALIGCDAAYFAWEWLRRNPEYRRAARQGRRSEPARFGLHHFEDPDRPSTSARLWWRADTDPHVLVAMAEPGRGADAFDPHRLASITSMRTDVDGTERLLLAKGPHALRIDITCGTLRQGPVHLAWALSGLGEVLAPMATLHRLIKLHRTGCFAKAGQPSPAQARRMALLLRVHDALADGASQRAIAVLLFGEDHLGTRWRIDAPAYRLRAQRLVQAAGRMARLHPALLLRGTHRPSTQVDRAGQF